MLHALSRTGRKIALILASRYFFVAILTFFVIEALWFVASAAYPMAFDEEYHFGLIKAFAEGFSPFATTQPESMDSFSAIIRDPSYLYHLLMSLPYRFLALFTDSQTTLVILLRLLNVALFTGSLVLFHKVLLKVKTSPALAHTALAIFVLIPIVPQLAAHLNYDNLLMVVVAWMCLLVAKILDGLQRRELYVSASITLLLVCLASSLIKYESLPFVVMAVLFVGIAVWRTFRRDVWHRYMAGFRQLSRRSVLVFVGTGIVLVGLAAQRYGVNMWQYQALKPTCDQVLTERRCEAFGPWARDHRLAQTKGDVNVNPLFYTGEWLQGLHLRLFFAVSGPENRYANYPPLPVPATTAVIVAVMGSALLLWNWRKVFAGRRLLAFLCLMSALYLGALWFENYSKFLETGQPVAINGRYLLPVLLPFAAVIGRAFTIALRGKLTFKALGATAVIILFLQGGGILTFITRSDSGWYWPNSTIRSFNENARRALKPIIIEGKETY